MSTREELLGAMLEAASAGDVRCMARAFDDLVVELLGTSAYDGLLSAYVAAVGHIQRGECAEAVEAILHYRPIIMEETDDDR